MLYNRSRGTVIAFKLVPESSFEAGPDSGRQVLPRVGVSTEQSMFTGRPTPLQLMARLAGEANGTACMVSGVTGREHGREP